MSGTAYFPPDNKIVSQVARNIMELKQRRRKKYFFFKTAELALVTRGRALSRFQSRHDFSKEKRKDKN